MQFLIEIVTQDQGLPIREARRWALVPTLAEARDLAAEACGDSGGALSDLERLGRVPEGELAGEWGRVRFAPAA